MIDKVSFCGFKNTGVQMSPLCDQDGELKMLLTIFNTRLTNDVWGKDLKTFKSVLKKSSNLSNKKILNLRYWQFMQNADRAVYNDIFEINGVEYPVNKNNLKLFQNLANLLKDIKDAPGFMFYVSKGYYKTPVCIDNFLLPERYVNKENLKIMHEPESVRKVCNYLLDEITGAVAEFLGC